MKITKLDPVFNGIVCIQKQLEDFFKQNNIFLCLESVCNDKNLPAFRSNISDSSGTSLDITFTSEVNMNRITFHLLNREAFMFSFENNSNMTSESLPMNRFENEKFLKGLSDLFNVANKDHAELRKESFDFLDKVGRTKI